jgi:hypothetical protein
MTVIFAKTRKGQAEIETRSAGLGVRARRVLILLDGRRSLDEVREMVADPRLDETLAMLQMEGYIESVEAATSSPAAARNDQPAAAGSAAPSDPAQVDKARNFMLNAMRTFNGPYHNIDLMTRIQGARGADELRGLVDAWLTSIELTKMGRLRAEELRLRVLEVL